MELLQATNIQSNTVILNGKTSTISNSTASINEY